MRVKTLLKKKIAPVISRSYVEYQQGSHSVTLKGCQYCKEQQRQISIVILSKLTIVDVTEMLAYLQKQETIYLFLLFIPLSQAIQSQHTKRTFRDIPVHSSPRLHMSVLLCRTDRQNKSWYLKYGT